MKKSIIAVIMCLLVVPLGYAKTIEGVKLPDTLKSGDIQLVLNGGGKRSKFFMKLYVAGLYLQQKSSEAQKIINDNQPMAIRLHITSGLITSDKMEKATRDGFRNATDGKDGSLKTEIDSFMEVFKEKINENDAFDLIYNPNAGTEIYKNGTLKNTIKGMDFKKAVFGIWLSEDPADGDLKDGMLGD
ncbi:chalcone isomerase family protein [Deltaproteobacteria bacterium TL4]